MSNININNLSMHYGQKLLFDDVSLNLNKGRRYGVVGANGTGKSTFLRVLAGEEQATLGDVNIAKQIVLGWLKQDQFRYHNDLVLEVVLQGKPELWKTLQEKQKLLTQENFDEKAGLRLAELEEKIGHLNGYTAEPLAEKLLTGLGIKQEYIYEPLSMLSGGFKLRVLLAQALFQQPDILLLDEPTNHLDIMTIAWLENYLKTEYEGLLVYISHDVDFVNNLSTDILDIDYGEIRHYVGNYTIFLKEKELVMQQKLKDRKHIEEKIKHLQDFVDRFRYKATKARQAQSRAKAIEKIELPDIKNSSRVSPTFRFQQKRPSGKNVLQIEGISKSFGDNTVLTDISLNIVRGEKVALIGHNGIGKSTLLKVALGKIEADKGKYEWGYETHIGYFAQDHHELLKENMNIYDWLTEHAPSNVTSTEIRSMLGQMLFRDDDVYKSIQSLSGGEAARLLLANMMLMQANVIILDEPTNHLDIEAIDSLAKAVSTFEGTLILVSHDRHFVSKIATRVIALTEAGIKDFKGSYTEYLSYYGDDFLNREWLITQQ